MTLFPPLRAVLFAVLAAVPLAGGCAGVPVKRTVTPTADESSGVVGLAEEQERQLAEISG